MGALLTATGICKHYRVGRERVHAVHDVSLRIDRGECVGLVGESGCGKSTVAGIVTSLIQADAGRVLLEGRDISAGSGRRRNVCTAIQMVFQSPADSFNPRLTLGDSIIEGLINQGIAKQEARNLTLEYLGLCGLPKTFADRYPHQVSGGECQRASIARAIAVQPKLLICDEATSALDVTIQAQIIDLIAKLRRELSMSCLLISHDIALIWEICDRVMIMCEGEIIEDGIPSDIISHPKQEYTRSLIEAAFLSSAWGGCCS
ncbi:ABC transporter ATP-binding protein [Desulfofustis glycolicus]|uniref:Peptide/nickel transport system ATP-binding protein n=1 Tax=Desulfofustis glycolicus DSM 9705 TaxID=1121409 RepID=A0A1M5X0V6_9BACT|nr:dipeptide/oligopeptide/nickel ABC transporter ATP-binding protein [Desulfofustis glycolicus]MCB2215543.1 dipeptide/oligopeptide/nickel ABC transporter ATP-binding protein [Desulfobulbaceae bacterium]SHH93499.1 peptide/nickel transport system ATP-binding protein [Desulfofustis glycolicus DSM 9705]